MQPICSMIHSDSSSSRYFHALFAVSTLNYAVKYTHSHYHYSARAIVTRSGIWTKSSERMSRSWPSRSKKSSSSQSSTKLRCELYDDDGYELIYTISCNTTCNGHQYCKSAQGLLLRFSSLYIRIISFIFLSFFSVW